MILRNSRRELVLPIVAPLRKPYLRVRFTQQIQHFTHYRLETILAIVRDEKTGCEIVRLLLKREVKLPFALDSGASEATKIG